MKRNSQKGIALLLIVHSVGLLVTLGYVLKEFIVFLPHMQGRGLTEILILFFLNKGLGWLLVGFVFLQYLRSVNRQWQKEGFRGRILFQLYSAYYLLELFRIYGARAELSSMGVFYYFFLLLFVLQGGISVVLYMIRSMEKPLEEEDEQSKEKKQG